MADSADNTAAPESIEIIGLTAAPLIVTEQAGGDLKVTPAAGGAPPPASDKAIPDSLGADDSKESNTDAAKPADKAAASDAGVSKEADDSAETGEEDAGEEGDGGDTDGEEDDESGEKKEGGDDEGEEDEEKSDDEKKDDEEEKEEEEKKPEPSEADQLVEALGGVEVLKAAQPLIEAAFDPDATPEQKYEAVKDLFGERGTFELNNQFFWGAIEEPVIQELLVADPVAQEVFAEKVLGVPFGFLRKITEEQRPLYTEEELAEFKPRADKAADKKPKAEEKTADEKRPAKKEEKKEEKQAEFSQAFQSVVASLNDAVEEIVTAEKLPEEKLDDFNAALSKAWGQDEPAMKLMSRVRRLADEGRSYKPFLPALEKHAKRIASQVATTLQAPAAQKTKQAQERAARAEKTRKETPGVKEAAKKEAVKETKAGEKKSAIEGIAARFPGGKIPDPDSPEFARFLEEDLQRRLQAGIGQ
jgi:hypothetical protein